MSIGIDIDIKFNCFDIVLSGVVHVNVGWGVGVGCMDLIVVRRRNSMKTCGIYKQGGVTDYTRLEVHNEERLRGPMTSGHVSSWVCHFKSSQKSRSEKRRRETKVASI